MEILIDTHVYLWAITEPKKLSRRARKLIEDRRTTVRVSSATAWEISTKWRLGKLPEGRAFVESYAAHLAKLTAEELAVTSKHAIAAGSFLNAHRDPFDRMLAAQAMTEGIPLVSRDEVFEDFPIDLIW